MTAQHPTWQPILLVLILLADMLAACEPAPNPAAPVTREDAVLLMIAGTAGLATDATELAEAAGMRPGLARASQPAPAAAEGINEIRVWQQLIQAQCAETRAVIETTVPDAEQQARLIAQFDAACQAHVAALEAQAQALEQARQRRRGRPWINLRQLGRWLDKNVVQGALPTAIETFLTSGGSVPFGRVLRRTLLANLRRGIRQEARIFLGRRLAREGVPREWLQLAGLPTPSGSTRSATGPPPPTAVPGQQGSSDTFFGLPERGNWTATCRLRTELDKLIGTSLAYWTRVDYQLNLNLGERTFTLAVKASHDSDIGAGQTGREIWTGSGQGQLFEDGFLAGTETSTWTIQTIRDGNVVQTSSHATPPSLVYGAFTDDLNSVYVSTGGAAGVQDVEWARKMGRSEFFKQSYAQCDIAAGP